MVLTHAGRSSAKQLRKDRARTRRELAAAARKQLRARLSQLREEIRTIKRGRPARIRHVRELCRIGRQVARERAREAREELKRQRLELRERTRAERANARDNCKAAVEAEVRHVGDAVTEREATLRELRRAARDDRMLDAAISAMDHDTRTPAERRAEEESEVEANIPDELRAVWERVKGKIKARPRETLTEAFLHWVHDHSAEVAEIVHEDAVEELRMREREAAHLAKLHKRWKRRGGPPPPELVEILEQTGELPRRSTAPKDDDDDGGEWGGF